MGISPGHNFDASDEQTLLDLGSPAGRVRRLLNVVALLVITAMLFSYLGAYAVTNALIATEVLPPWTPGTDPRPRRLLLGFFSLMGGFGLCAIVARVVGRRQMRRIDAMNDDA